MKRKRNNTSKGIWSDGQYISPHSNHNGQGRHRALQTRFCMKCIPGTLKEATKALNKSGLGSETGNNDN
jgi:hypothetical protein